MAKSLLDVLRDVSLDPSKQAAFAADSRAYLAQYGYEDVEADDLTEAFGLVADTLPPEAAASLPSAGLTPEPSAPAPPGPGDQLGAGEPFGAPTGGALDAGYGADFAEDDDGLADDGGTDEPDDSAFGGGSGDGDADGDAGEGPAAGLEDAMGFGEGSVEADPDTDTGGGTTGFDDWGEDTVETVGADAAFDQGALGAVELDAADFGETDDGFGTGGDDFGTGDAFGGNDDPGGDDYDDIGSF